MANILYVDDEAAIRLILQDTLERLGHVAIGAASVPEALGALSRGDVDLLYAPLKDYVERLDAELDAAPQP